MVGGGCSGVNVQVGVQVPKEPTKDPRHAARHCSSNIITYVITDHLQAAGDNSAHRIPQLWTCMLLMVLRHRVWSCSTHAGHWQPICIQDVSSPTPEAVCWPMSAANHTAASK